MNELLEQALFTLLSTDATLVSLLWDTPAGAMRIYPLRAPQEAPTPRLQYYQSSRSQQQSLTGPVSPATAKIQMDIYATYAVAKQVAEAVRNVFRVFVQGGCGWLPGSMVYAQRASLDELGRDSLEPPVHGDESGAPSVSLEASITYEQT